MDLKKQTIWILLGLSTLIANLTNKCNGIVGLR